MPCALRPISLGAQPDFDDSSASGKDQDERGQKDVSGGYLNVLQRQKLTRSEAKPAEKKKKGRRRQKAAAKYEPADMPPAEEPRNVSPQLLPKAVRFVTRPPTPTSAEEVHVVIRGVYRLTCPLSCTHATSFMCIDTCLVGPCVGGCVL